jgi:hypothetical protein
MARGRERMVVATDDRVSSELHSRTQSSEETLPRTMWQWVEVACQGRIDRYMKHCPDSMTNQTMVDTYIKRMYTIAYFGARAVVLN